MSASLDPTRWELKSLHPDGGEPVAVPPPGLTLGRSPSNGVVISTEDFPGVSATHARITLRDGDLFIEDLNSSNGTLIDGHRVHQRQLRHGDVIELGPGGPRFAVISDQAMDQTALIEDKPRKRKFGRETVELMREELGIPTEANVDDLLREQSRRHGRRVTAVIALTVVALGIGAWAVTQFGSSAYAKLESRTDALAKRLEEQMSAAKSAVEAQRSIWNEQTRRLEAARTEWERRRTELENKRASLEQSVRSLQASEKQATGRMAQLRATLEETTRQLASYDPINLEQSRLDKVSAMERAVVMVEVTQTFREKESGRQLYIDRDGSGEMVPNLDGRGRPLMRQSNGSGFCFSPEGWFLTNAHVVVKEPMREPFSLGPDIDLEPHSDVAVVFSGTDVRYPAKVIGFAYEGRQDLALLKIEPFAGIPHVDGFDLEAPPPTRGSDVFVIGFPLGKRAIQQGDTVIASTFRGIVSRIVDGYIQVDAAIHPGASGGPVIDGLGNVLGVVVGMQRITPDTSTSAIGYIIPIAQARDLWPPK